MGNEKILHLEKRLKERPYSKLEGFRTRNLQPNWKFMKPAFVAQDENFKVDRKLL